MTNYLALTSQYYNIRTFSDQSFKRGLKDTLFTGCQVESDGQHMTARGEAILVDFQESNVACKDKRLPQSNIIQFCTGATHMVKTVLYQMHNSNKQ